MVQAHAFFADIDWNKVLKMKLKAVFLPRTSHEEDLSYFEARNEDFPIGSTILLVFCFSSSTSCSCGLTPI